VGRHTLALTPQDTSSATTVAGLAAADNPLTTTDPTGHFVEPATVAAWAASVAATDAEASAACGPAFLVCPYRARTG
jgi:hypothetical protein